MYPKETGRGFSTGSLLFCEILLEDFLLALILRRLLPCYRPSGRAAVKETTFASKTLHFWNYKQLRDKTAAEVYSGDVWGTMTEALHNLIQKHKEMTKAAFAKQETLWSRDILSVPCQHWGGRILYLNHPYAEFNLVSSSTAVVGMCRFL